MFDKYPSGPSISTAEEATTNEGGGFMEYVRREKELFGGRTIEENLWRKESRNGVLYPTPVRDVDGERPQRRVNRGVFAGLTIGAGAILWKVFRHYISRNGGNSNE